MIKPSDSQVVMSSDKLCINATVYSQGQCERLIARIHALASYLPPSTERTPLTYPNVEEARRRHISEIRSDAAKHRWNK
jgi:hypothetical protein